MAHSFVKDSMRKAGRGRGSTDQSFPHNSKYEGSLSYDDFNPSQASLNAASFAAKVSKSASHRQRKTLPNHELNNCLEELSSVWLDDRLHDKKQKSDALSKVLSKYLASTDCNPWETALCVVVNAEDYFQAKTTTLSYTVLVLFSKWTESSDNVLSGKESEYLSEDLRTRVFYATTGKHIPYFNTAVKAFYLNHPGNEYLLPMAQAMLVRNKLTEAAQVICQLGLHSHFKLEEVLMPLVFTDKNNVIETYIAGEIEQQKSVLGLLDHLCARSVDILSFAQNAGIKNIKGEKLSKKVLSKFAMRLMKLYDIPPEQCPNISENRAMSSIRYLLYRYYIEKSMGRSSWEDMVESAICDNATLKCQLIQELQGYNDIEEAVRWAERFQLPDSDLTFVVADARRQFRESQDEPCAQVSSDYVEEEDWDAQIAAEAQPTKPFSIYYIMPLSLSKVVLVDTREKLQQCIQRITRPYSTLGLDAEWKPSMGSREQTVALLQVATDDQVFLIDFVQLRPHLVDEEWGQLATAIFGDEKVLKIGYGLDTDLRMLLKSFPSMQTPLLRMVRVVDVETLAKVVIPNYETYLMDMSKFDKEGELINPPTGRAGTNRRKVKEPEISDMVYKREEKGLSLLVKRTLGRPLCKGEQMSNWDKRPLRQSQITYAATDAYVLLEVYNWLVSQGHALGLSKLELEPPVTLRMKTRMDKKKARANSANKKTGKAARPSSQAQRRLCTRPSDLRVVCDTMLQGLESQLRSCGVDTVILSNSQKHIDAIQISRKEGRIVLTTGGPFDQIRANVGEAMCYCVAHDQNARDQCTDVLKAFGVRVTQSDIFSRCCVCNSADFALIPSKEMETLYIYHLQQQQHRLMGGGQGSMSLYDVEQSTRSRFLKFGVDPATITFLHNRVKIQVDTIPKRDAFSNIDTFYVCVNCGKVFWEGTHYARICSQFQHVLSLSANPEGEFEDSCGQDGQMEEEDEDSSFFIEGEEEGEMGKWVIGLD